MLFTLVSCRENNIIKSEDKLIEEKLSKIVDTNNVNVQVSSNPYDYITNSKEEYADIISMEGSLEYMINEFAKSNEDGLKEHIMALACCDILGEDVTNKQWNSGREWYTNYLYIKES